MTDDAVRLRLGWVEPGRDLPYKTHLAETGRWPPGTASRSPGGDVERPATPFLYFPTGSSDVGERDRDDAAWIDSNALMLLDPDFNVATTPRPGVSYRILALVRNSGDAPALSTFVEFKVTSPGSGEFIGHAPLPPGLDLGVAALSVGSRDTSWAISPRSWTPSNQYDLGLAMAARVLEPSRSSPDDWLPWSDRHVAAKALTPDLSGIWVGTEAVWDSDTEKVGAVIGEIRLELQIEWPLQTYGGPRPVDIVVLPRICRMLIQAISPFGSRPIPAGSLYLTNFYYDILLYALPSSDLARGTRQLALWMAPDGSLELRTSIRTSEAPYPTEGTIAKLQRVAAGLPPPDRDRGLFGTVNLEVGPVAPRSRREEAARLKQTRGD